MLKVLVGYPTETEEFVIVERMTGDRPDGRSRCSRPTACSAMQQAADAVYVDPALFEYAVRLATATRAPERYGLQRAQAATSPSAPARARRST